MRWFPVNVIVLLQDVEIDLYMPIEALSFLTNDLTSLYLTVPCAETVKDYREIDLTVSLKEYINNLPSSG